jgi:hypothetical protein
MTPSWTVFQGTLVRNQSCVGTDEKPLNIRIADVFGALARDYTEAEGFHLNG